jgi:hypothetical protein
MELLCLVLSPRPTLVPADRAVLAKNKSFLGSASKGHIPFGCAPKKNLVNVVPNQLPK